MEGSSRRPPAQFLDEHQRHVTIIDVIDRLADDVGIVFLQPVNETADLTLPTLLRRFTAVAAAAGMTVRVRRNNSGRISVQCAGPVMGDARVRAAMNEPPAW